MLQLTSVLFTGVNRFPLPFTALPFVGRGLDCVSSSLSSPNRELEGMSGGGAMSYSMVSSARIIVGVA